VFAVLSVFDTGVELLEFVALELIEFVTVLVASEVPISRVLLEGVLEMLGVAVVLESEVVFLLSLCLVVLNEARRLFSSTGRCIRGVRSGCPFILHQPTGYRSYDSTS